MFAKIKNQLPNTFVDCYIEFNLNLALINVPLSMFSIFPVTVWY